MSEQKISPIDLQKSLSGIGYPAKRDELVKHAQSHGGKGAIADKLKKLPDQEYDGPNAVSQAVFRS